MNGKISTGFASVIMGGALILGACATSREEQKKKEDFFTSGSPEADRRAAKVAPTDKKGISKTEPLNAAEAKATGHATNAVTEAKLTLYDRLGGEQGIATIVDDFLKRALADPRVNWERKDVIQSTWLRSKKVPAWQATPENVKSLKTRFVQFISLATGGPVKYVGKPIKAAHANMQITKAEFDAAIGDLKATLDHLGIANDVQKDLLAIIESTRPQIVIGKDR